MALTTVFHPALEVRFPLGDTKTTRKYLKMHIVVYSVATNEYSRQKMSSNVGLLEPMC